MPGRLISNLSTPSLILRSACVCVCVSHRRVQGDTAGMLREEKVLLSQCLLKLVCGVFQNKPEGGEQKGKQQHRWTCRCSSPPESAAAAVNIHCVEFFSPTKVQRLKMSPELREGEAMPVGCFFYGWAPMVSVL